MKEKEIKNTPKIYSIETRFKLSTGEMASLVIIKIFMCYDFQKSKLQKFHTILEAKDNKLSAECCEKIGLYRLHFLESSSNISINHLIMFTKKRL